MLHRPEELESLGARFKKAREARQFSIKDLSHAVQIASKYIEALEEDNFEVFPAKVYATGFFRKSIKILGVEGQEELVKEFNNEWDVRMFRKRKEAVSLPENRGKSPIVTPKRLTLSIFTLAMVAFFIFMSSRVIHFLQNPALVIEAPIENAVSTDPVTKIKGKVEKESLLTVNGREVTIDESGNFENEFELIAGVNALEFIAKDKFGKMTKEVRYILVK